MNGNLTANLNLTPWPFGIEKREYYIGININNQNP